MLVSRLYTSNINLLPFNRNIVGFENSFHGFRNLAPDAVTWPLHVSINILIAGLKKLPCASFPLIPGMSVTVYFPPNFVGLKMSD